MSEREIIKLFISIMFTIIVTCILLTVIGGGWLIVRGCQSIEEKGVKNIAETIWDGPNTNTVPKI